MGEVQNYRDRTYRDDTVFQMINKKFLTLQEEDRRSNNEHLKAVVEQIFIRLMKEDELFSVLYKRITYGGSFYKGTKYGTPNEFDLLFVIKLPIVYNKITIDTNHDDYGFVKIKLDTQGPMHPNWEKHSKKLNSWLDSNGYLDQDKFSRWMQCIFEGAYRKLNKNSNNSYVMEYKGKNYVVKYSKSGPAFTMIIQTPSGFKIDVDLVPCLEFDNVPLENGYRTMNGNKKNWMVVAKPLKDNPNGIILWRLCFYEQEKELLKGDVKPVIRMMKKFRDTRDWKSIASYFIETIFYHELENNKHDLDRYLRAPKTWLFMNGLKKLKDAFSTHNLPYFWHENHNLLGKINRAELTGYANYLQRQIALIDGNIERDRFVLANLVLTRSEVDSLRTTNALEESMGNLQVSNEQVPAAAESSSRCIIS